MPVGRVKDLRPLGHSGHRRLQDVVGSMEMLIGKPLIRASFLVLELWKGLTIRAPLAPRTKVIRPEAGSYNSNALAANTMFQMNLNDRLSSY